jgi:hypothetical protein
VRCAVKWKTRSSGTPFNFFFKCFRSILWLIGYRHKDVKIASFLCITLILDNIESGLQNKYDDDDDIRTSSSDEDEDDDEVFELPSKEDLIHAKKDKTMRTSVSAEAYGKFNKKKDFKAQVIHKSD